MNECLEVLYKLREKYMYTQPKYEVITEAIRLIEELINDRKKL